MIGRTFGIYFARQFFKNVVLIYALIFVLIVAVDLTDQARRMSRYPDVPFTEFLMISLAKGPSFSERILPFAVLFGCIATLVVLNKRMELVVARAAGVSVWQFIWPAGITAVLLGLFSMMVYNPLSLQSTEYGKSIEARVYGKKGNAEAGRTRKLWIRQYSSDGDMIIHASISRKQGQLLNGVTAYRFDKNGFVSQRIDASKAAYHASVGAVSAYWQFSDVSITVSGRLPIPKPNYRVDTNLSIYQLGSAAIVASDVSFWGLLERASQAESAGKSADKFLMQFQVLAARPLFFVAMVLIAATVSLRFVRFGQSGKVILTGILAGFVLYVITELVIGFGKNGIVSPVVAAWSPVTVATLIGVTILLHQEDG